MNVRLRARRRVRGGLIIIASVLDRAGGNAELEGRRIESGSRERWRRCVDGFEFGAGAPSRDER